MQQDNSQNINLHSFINKLCFLENQNRCGRDVTILTCKRKEREPATLAACHHNTTIRLLACQGLALRGDGDEKDSNFLQLLMLREDSQH